MPCGWWCCTVPSHYALVFGKVLVVAALTTRWMSPLTYPLLIFVWCINNHYNLSFAICQKKWMCMNTFALGAHWAVKKLFRHLRIPYTFAPSSLLWSSLKRSVLPPRCPVLHSCPDVEPRTLPSAALTPAPSSQPAPSILVPPPPLWSTRRNPGSTEQPVPDSPSSTAPEFRDKWRQIRCFGWKDGENFVDRFSRHLFLLFLFGRIVEEVDTNRSKKMWLS